MRARVGVTGALCGAALIASGCQQGSGPQETTPESSVPRSTMSTAGASGAGTDEPGSSTSTAPSSTRRMFDPESMRTSVLRLLRDTYGIDGVQQISCPSGKEVVDGNSFRCSVVIDGQQKHVTITVRGTDGAYGVSRPE